MPYTLENGFKIFYFLLIMHIYQLFRGKARRHHVLPFLPVDTADLHLDRTLLFRAGCKICPRKTKSHSRLAQPFRIKGVRVGFEDSFCRTV